MANRYLLSSDDRADYFDLISQPTGAKAHLGDPEKMTLTANRVRGIHADVASHVQALSRLARDSTRTEAQQHLAARDIGTFLHKRLAESAQVLREGAKTLHTEALTLADDAFNKALISSAIESDIRVYARELASQPGGKVKLAALASKNVELAAAIYRSPSFLVGLNDAEHKDLKLDSIADHVPEATTRMVESAYLTKTAGTYESTAKMFLSVFSPTIVERAEKGRVEMPTPAGALN